MSDNSVLEDDMGFAGEKQENRVNATGGERGLQFKWLGRASVRR